MTDVRKETNPKAVAAKLRGLSSDATKFRRHPLWLSWCPYCGLGNDLTRDKIEARYFECECGAPVFLEEVFEEF